MAFLETPRLPVAVSLGMTGGPEQNTEVVTVSSGYEFRNQSWQQARARYDVSYTIGIPDKWKDLIEFARAVRGKLHGFRVKDWTDYQCLSGEGIMGTGVGTGATAYQLKKRTVVGVLTDDRNIKKPALGLVNLFKNGIQLTYGGGAGQVVFDESTGIVTFNTAPTGSDTLTWVGEFDIPCRFDIDLVQLEIINKQLDGNFTVSWSSIPLVEIRVP